MNVAKIVISLPKLPSPNLRDYMLSIGFSRSQSQPRAWEAEINDKTLKFSDIMNKRYENEKVTIIKFYSTPPREITKEIIAKGFVYNPAHKQWYGIKSNLTEALITDVQIYGIINYLD